VRRSGQLRVESERLLGCGGDDLRAGQSLLQINAIPRRLGAGVGAGAVDQLHHVLFISIRIRRGKKPAQFEGFEEAIEHGRFWNNRKTDRCSNRPLYGIRRHGAKESYRNADLAGEKLRFWAIVAFLRIIHRRDAEIAEKAGSEMKLAALFRREKN
jgi:hypothetical protein